MLYLLFYLKSGITIGIFSIFCLMIIHFIITYHLHLRLTELAYMLIIPGNVIRLKNTTTTTINTTTMTTLSTVITFYFHGDCTLGTQELKTNI